MWQPTATCLQTHPFRARLAIASGELRAVTDKEIHGVACAFGAIGDDVTALRHAARPDKEFLASALDGLFDFGRSGFVFWFGESCSVSLSSVFN